MNKTAIKNFAISAREKLIADITYKAGLIGVSADGIKQPLPQSTKDMQFFDIGLKEYSPLEGKAAIEQRNALVKAINDKAAGSDYTTAFNAIMEEIAYTWFNRLIAIRFMEVNDYLPGRVRVLSSELDNKNEPDLVTNPFDSDLEFTDAEKEQIFQMKDQNKLEELFRMLFIKQCNKLHEILPELFETTNDYTELLLNIAFADKEGVVYKLVHDIPEDDFNVEKEGQVEIIGWMYQYYNTVPKDETFALLKKNVKITKERIPAATQLFTPDWIVRYMVENSLGRLWVEGHPNDDLKANWKYYLEEAEQEPDVVAQLETIRAEYKTINPADIKVIDPCMGSGHILVYCFDVLMQIYEAQGYTQRDAAQSILENNLYGLDIDNRAAQLAYFAVMMKARQYDRRIFSRDIKPHVYAIQESNTVNRNHLAYLGAELSPIEKNNAINEINGLLNTFVDAKEYGSILNVENYNWPLLRQFVAGIDQSQQMTLETIGIEVTQAQLKTLVEIGETMARKYHVVVTNPPYMGSSGMGAGLSKYVKDNYPDSKSDLFACFISRNIKYTCKYGFTSMITMESWMFLGSFDKLRIELLKTTSLECLTHMPYLGKGGTSLGINFGTTMFVLRKYCVMSYYGNYNSVTYLDTDEDGVPREFPVQNERNKVQNQENFKLIPSAPFGYWLSEQSFLNFSKMDTIGKYINPRIGLITGDNTRFLRLWHEVDSTTIGFEIRNIQESIESKKKWFPYQKGGDFRRWYGNMDYVVDWENDGFMMKNDNYDKGRVRSHNYNGEYSFIPGITWTSVTTGNFACRYVPEGFLFDAAGPICKVNDNENIPLFLGVLSSVVAKYYLSVINPTINFHPGYIMAIPFSMSCVEKCKEKIIVLTKENIDISKDEWNQYEHSWAFAKHPLCSQDVKYIKVAFCLWEEQCNHRRYKIKENEIAINSMLIESYGLTGEVDASVDDELISIRKADIHSDVVSLLSYAVGCMFGRYSLDVDGLAYAGGEWDDSKYSTFIPDKDNCIPITDEEYFEDDIVGLFCAWLKKVYGEDTLEENLEFIANALGNKGKTSREVIRNYFLNDFFKDHCSTYSVTGSGKRPIYWLFDSGKQNGFKALVYMHRWNADTVGNLRVEYLHRMQRVYEKEIDRMKEIADTSKDNKEISAANKRKDKLMKQLQETQKYDEKIGHIALSRIDIDLDDGVKVNYEKVQTGKDGKKVDILAKI